MPLAMWGVMDISHILEDQNRDGLAAYHILSCLRRWPDTCRNGRQTRRLLPAFQNANFFGFSSERDSINPGMKWAISSSKCSCGDVAAARFR